MTDGPLLNFNSEADIPAILVNHDFGSEGTLKNAYSFLETMDRTGCLSNDAICLRP